MANLATVEPGQWPPDWFHHHTAIDDNVIRIRGARQHNLKNIDLELPRNQLIVFTGGFGVR